MLPSVGEFCHVTATGASSARDPLSRIGCTVYAKILAFANLVTMAALCSYYIRLAFQAPEDPGEYPELPGPGWVHIRYSINEAFPLLVLIG